VTLYSVPEIGYTRRKVNKTIANARLGAAQNKSGTGAVTTWISLCGGYRQGFEYDESNFDMRWDRMYSWKMGYELDNNCGPLCIGRYADFDYVKTVVFYTSVFDVRTKVYANSTWQAGVQHFVSFVRGAAVIKDLSPV
jgi:hypothetical protein